MSFTKCIFGDNQFLGVSHSNQAKATTLFKKFKNPDNIIDLLGIAYDAGVRDFMFTTHDRYELVFDEIRRSNLFPGLYYSPCLPYAHKYWNKISQVGFSGMLTSLLSQVNPLNLTREFSKSIFLRKNHLTKLLIDIEILMCKGLPIRGIFLQNLAFDVLLAMNLLNYISGFNEVVVNRFGVIPGFITMNHSLAVTTLSEKIGFDKPWVCANYNMSGFRMHPSKIICESSFASGKSNNIAMSVMSFGNNTPDESLDYVLKKQRKGDVNSILFGSSNKDNIYNNIKRITTF